MSKLKDAFDIIKQKNIKPGDDAFALVRISRIKVVCPTCRGVGHEKVVVFNIMKDVPCPTCQGDGKCDGYEIANIHVHSICIHESNKVYYRDYEYTSSFSSDRMFKTYEEAAEVMNHLNTNRVKDSERSSV